MYYYYCKKFSLFMPAFFGCLGSLALCALLATQTLGPVLAEDTEDAKNEETALGVALGVAEDIAKPKAKVPETTPNIHFFARARGQDYILGLYRQPETQGIVIDFFTKICRSSEVAEMILTNAELFNIPPALAFSLSWEESRFNPRAVNTRNRDSSIDRGLFQLNNRSFPRLDLQAFFNPETNAYYGMSHLRYCLDTGGTEIAALAMYNAGSGRVHNTGTPKTTLDYVSRILDNRREIEQLFFEWESQFHEEPGTPHDIVETEPDIPRSFLLTPLGIR